MQNTYGLSLIHIFLDSGENVSPEELEKLLGKCDAIKECIVKEMGKKIGTVEMCIRDSPSTSTRPSATLRWCPCSIWPVSSATLSMACRAGP